MTTELTGKRVLIVEDEFACALFIEDFLDELGCVHVGPIGTVAAALEAIKTHYDLVLLDMNLNGEMSYPIADALKLAGERFLCVSGYDDCKDFPGPHLSKPFRLHEFERAVGNAMLH